ncbi:retron St85 family RNA-directed DNA polymerase [Escherichia coli]
MTSATPSQVFRLRNLGLPVMSSLEDMSREMRLSVDILRLYIYRADKYYKVYSLPKRDGKRSRIISQPSRELKALQAWVLRNILDKLHSSPFSKGFEKGQSILNNASPHVGANYVLNIDLEDCFNTILIEKIYTVFHSLGYNSTISNALARLCSFNGSLPQGAPSSPKIANLVLTKLDYRIHGYAGSKGIVFTRYADDLTLSAQSLKKIFKAKSFVCSIIPSESLKVNYNKVAIHGPKARKEVTGLVLSIDNVGVGRIRYREIRSKIHYLAVKRNSDFEHVKGLIAFVKSVDKKNYRKLMTFSNKMSEAYGVDLSVLFPKNKKAI